MTTDSNDNYTKSRVIQVSEIYFGLDAFTDPNAHGAYDSPAYERQTGRKGWMTRLAVDLHRLGLAMTEPGADGLSYIDLCQRAQDAEMREEQDNG